MIDLRMDRVLERRVDASDIVQDVLIEANRRLSDYLANPIMPFHLWLRQMAKDRLIDAHRRHRVAARRSMDREQPLAAATTSDEESALDLAGPVVRRAAHARMRPRPGANSNAASAEACEQLDAAGSGDHLDAALRETESNSEVAQALDLSATGGQHAAPPSDASACGSHLTDEDHEQEE